MNTLELDAEAASALADCKDGETKTLQVTGTVTRGEDGSLTLSEVYDVTPVDDEEYEEPEESEAPPAMKKVAVKVTVKKPTPKEMV